MSTTVPFVINYFFEVDQQLSVKIAFDSFKEEIKSPLALIIGSKQRTRTFNLPQSGINLSISAKIDESKIKQKLEITSAIKINSNESFFMLVSKGKQKLYKSEEIQGGKGHFKSVAFDLHLVSDPELNGDLTLSLFSLSKGLLVSYKGKIADILSLQTVELPEDAFFTGTFSFTGRLMNYSPFIELIESANIEMLIGIDFTASNGNVYSTESLHYCSSSFENQYMRAIKAAGNVVAFYDTDNLIPAFGFGANVPNKGVSHCFNLTLEDCILRGIQVLIEGN